MHEQSGIDQHVYPIRLSEEFSEGLSHIWSARVLDHIKGLISLLQTNPSIGSAHVRESLTKRYGEDIRKLTVSNFIIVYRFDGNVIDVLAIVYGPGVI